MADKHQNYGGMSTEAVKKATGKSWAEWLKVLDMIDATKMTHKEIAAWIYGKKLATGWWSQMVTVGYEQARGMREKYQKSGAKGYSVSVTATINTPLKKLYNAVADEKFRKLWLREKLEVSSTTKEKSFNAKWKDGSKVIAGFYFKGPEKSQIALEHSKLEVKAQVEEMRAFWKKRFVKLKELLESGNRTNTTKTSAKKVIK